MVSPSILSAHVVSRSRNAWLPRRVISNVRSWLVFLVLAAPACAQPFSFGVKAGVPATDFFDAVRSNNLGYFSTTNRYIVGGTAELHLPLGFGVEFDVLYRHLHYNERSM